MQSVVDTPCKAQIGGHCKNIDSWKVLANARYRIIRTVIVYNDCRKLLKLLLLQRYEALLNHFAAVVIDDHYRHRRWTHFSFAFFLEHV